jgi:hypothetical protein
VTVDKDGTRPDSAHQPHKPEAAKDSEDMGPEPERADGEHRRPSVRTELLPLLLLIAIPAVIFGGADLFGGHLLLSGDNLIQSFPLRVLVGADLRHGAWPTWDPFIWSGTPLLAGLNAGAFYPTTFLFAVMNSDAAWVIGEILITSSVATGTYLFLRVTGVSRAAAWLGAASFAFAGAIASQSAVHLDMGEGFASLPWILLAIRRIIDTGRWRWCVLLGLATTLLVLAGSPEAMLDTAGLSATYAIVRLSLATENWRRLVTLGTAAIAAAIGLSATVWLPAMKFIAVSQRASLGSSFSASYSYPPRALLLGLLPYAEGGSKLFSQPSYFGQSNLPEVGLYIGLLPLLAVFAMGSKTWRRWLPAGEQRTWYVIIVVGLVLAIGAGTPLQHLISHIPFYGKQRDQGRNIVDVDFAAAALFAWWVDGGQRRRAKARSDLTAGGVIIAMILAVGIWFVASPSTFWNALRAFPQPSSALGSLRAAVAISAAFALGAAVIVVARSRISRKSWLGLVTGFVLADLAIFSAGSSLLFSQAIPTPNNPGQLLQVTAKNLSGGRYAVFDPDLFYPGAVVTAGEPDVGIVVGLPSVQGYGAILDGRYSKLTETHSRAFFAPNALLRGEFRQLDLGVILAPAEAFLLPVAGVPSEISNFRFLAESPGVDPVLPAGDVPVPQDLLPSVVGSGTRAPIGDGQPAGWFFGTMADAKSVDLVLSAPTTGQIVRAGTISPTGAIHWESPRKLGNGATVATFPLSDTRTEGVEIEVLSGPRLGSSQLVLRSEGRSYLVDGPLAQSLTPALFSEVGDAGDFAVYRTKATPPSMWVEGSRTDPRLVSSTPNSATVAVSSAVSSVFVRSVAWDAGWHADVNGKPAPVRRIGLIQGVAIGAGSSLIHLWYEPPGFSEAAHITEGTLAILAGSLAGFLVRRRNSRERRAGAPAAPGD